MEKDDRRDAVQILAQMLDRLTKDNNTNRDFSKTAVDLWKSIDRINERLDALESKDDSE